MYLNRTMDAELEAWYESSPRKPLILRGARQTGKSTSVRAFGRTKPLFLEVSLERFSDARLASESRTPDEFLQALLLRSNLSSFPPGTVLFLDEIQEEPKAIGWLRWFFEDRPELAVIAAGSLLEVRMKSRGFGFPVGRVTFASMYPLSFPEFLEATQQEQRVGFLRDVVSSPRRIPEAIHQEFLDLLRTYIVVGGMPESVSRYVTEGGFAGPRRVHEDLIQAFSQDVQKYPNSPRYTELALRYMKNHYGLRFKYERFAPEGQSRQMREALDSLEGAMLLHRALPTSSVVPPLIEKVKAAPKLIPLDVGLALSDFGLSPTELATMPLEDLLGGRFAECFVGQQLRISASAAWPLYFWVRESSRASAEVDFLLVKHPVCIPVEVKSGTSGTLKSMHQYLWRSGGKTGIRLDSGNVSDRQLEIKMTDGVLCYRLISLPLYLASFLPDLVESL
jgi:hypothetical protein